MGCKEEYEAQKSICGHEKDLGYRKCEEEVDLGYDKCTEEADHGYDKCTEERDLGYSTCESWHPWTQWLCSVFVWVANIVCVVSTWVSNIVCVVWTWVSNVVCSSWVWVSNGTCVLLAEFSNISCSIGRTITGGEESGIGSGDLENLPPFPEDFLWGVATAGFQNEGYDENDTGDDGSPRKGSIKNCDWYAFTTSDEIKNRIAQLTEFFIRRKMVLEEAGEATNHRDLKVLREDIERARFLGMNCYRFSLEWSRLQPDKPNPTDATTGQLEPSAAQYYDGVIKLLKDYGMEPVVTLNHLTLPLWVLDPPRGSAISSLIGIPLTAEDDRFRASLRGWETAETVAAFVAFVKEVAKHYRDQGVKFWITLNEPAGSMAGVGYIAGIWPPGFNLDVKRAKIAYLNLLRAHVQAYQAIKEIYADRPSHVGIAHNMLFTKRSRDNPAVTGLGVGVAGGVIIGGVIGFLVAGPPGAIAGAAAGAVVGGTAGAIAGGVGDINAAARNQFDYFYNDHFLESLISGQVDQAIHRRPAQRDNVDARTFFGLSPDKPWSAKLDFIGINYYRSVYPRYSQIISLTADFTGGDFENDMRGKEDHLLLNDLGYETCPLGLYGVIQRVIQYNLPILIAENGMAETEDRNRAVYTVSHLQQLLRAIKDGAKVLGYIHWTLVDNFEWQGHYIPNYRFGLFTVQRDHVSQIRCITEGAFALRQVVGDKTTAGAVRRYGTITQDGQHVEIPDLSAGGMWLCTHERGDFKLFITRRYQGELVGCVFLLDQRKWLAISALSRANGLLQFSFNHPHGFRHDFTANWNVGMLSGTWKAWHIGPRGGEDFERRIGGSWRGDLVRPFGLWKTTDERLAGGFNALAFYSFEESDHWTGKRIREGESAEWRILENVGWDGNQISFYIDPYLYSASIQGDDMVGQRVRPGRSGPYMLPWAATRVPPDL